MQVSITFYDEETGRTCVLQGHRVHGPIFAVDSVDSNSMKSQALLAALPTTGAIDALALAASVALAPDATLHFTFAREVVCPTR